MTRNVSFSWLLWIPFYSTYEYNNNTCLAGCLARTGAARGGREAGGREARGHLDRALPLLRVQFALLPDGDRSRALLPRVAALPRLLLRPERIDRYSIRMLFSSPLLSSLILLRVSGSHLSLSLSLSAYLAHGCLYFNQLIIYSRVTVNRINKVCSISLSTLTRADAAKHERALAMSLAALLAEDMYSFGELVRTVLNALAIACIVHLLHIRVCAPRPPARSSRTRSSTRYSPHKTGSASCSSPSTPATWTRSSSSRRAGARRRISGEQRPNCAIRSQCSASWRCAAFCGCPQCTHSTGELHLFLLLLWCFFVVRRCLNVSYLYPLRALLFCADVLPEGS